MLAIGGDMRQPGLDALRRAGVRDIAPVQRNPARGGVQQPGQNARQFVLAVAVYAGNAVNLSGANVEIDAAQNVELALVAIARPSTATSGGAAAGAACSRRGRLTERPTISSASSWASVSPVRRVATTWPWRRTVTWPLMPMTSFSLWLIKITALPCWDRLPNHAKEAFRFLGVSTDVGSSRINSSAPR